MCSVRLADYFHRYSLEPVGEDDPSLTQVELSLTKADLVGSGVVATAAGEYIDPCSWFVKILAPKRDLIHRAQPR